MRKFTGIAGWVKWAISDKKLVYIIVLSLVVAGVFGLTYINKDEFPTFQIKQGLVAGIYPGATASEVEQQLTKPLEETLFSFKEVDRATTKSVTKDGVCYIYVDLTCKQSKKDEVWSKIKLGLQARKLTLPTGVLAVAVLDDFSAVSSVLIAMESDDKGYIELQNYADDLCERLRQIPTLAKVSVVGEQSEEIAVTLDREKLSSYGVDAAGLLLGYQSATLSLPSGTYSTDYVSSPIHIISGVSSEGEIAEKIIYTDPSGAMIRLKDVATIQRRYAEPSEFVSYNGHSCLVISVEMRPDNNIVFFGREVDDVLSEFSKDLPQSVKLSRISDQPKVVSRSVYSFLRDLLISMLVVILVMMMLFPIRSALIASSGVPVCTAVAWALMYVFKIDINTVTLAALIVCLGMIVDDSIITMDGYMDKLGKGMGKLDAACASAKELFMPTLIATVAICAMFYPMTFIITGYLGDFVKLFPWVVTLALMMSLFYAVTVVPSLEVKFIAPVDPDAPKSFVTRVQDRFFEAIQKVYDGAQGWCFRHPKMTIAGAVGAVMLGLLMFSRINIQMMPMAARDYFVIEMEVDSGHGIETTKHYVDSLEKILLADSRVESVTAFVGTSAPRFTATYAPHLPGPEVAQLIVNTKSTRATEAVLKEYEDKYEHIFPEVDVHFKQMDYNGSEAAISVTFSGNDRDALLSAAEKLKRYMSGMSTSLKWVHSDCDSFTPCVDIKLDADEASRLGVNKSVLALSLSGTFNGQTISNLWEDGRRIPVNLYSEGINKSMDYQTVSNQLVATSVPGVYVPLRQVATVSPDWTLSQLDHYAGEESVTVYADMKFGQSQPTSMAKIQKYIESDIAPELPKDTHIKYGGLSAANDTIFPQIAWSFIAAVLVLFVFLVFHFKKTSLAVLTLVMSLLCLFGAFFGLWIFGMDFTITAVLGLVSLVGIIVRNGILMFEYAEYERFKKGVDILTASMEAGKRRMRPIFLTSCTTALGVLPMILSGDQLWMPMGIVICFGTILSIFLIVLTMPVSYWLLFRADEREALAEKEEL
ncbi:MAG: efflux RND transporter permease subunit [Bacteroidales bacterium]|nr:efflux RND transporter permease subunit [Bacteroidales bacterium]